MARFDAKKISQHENSEAHKAAIKLSLKRQNVTIVNAFVASLSTFSANVKHKIRDAYFMCEV